MIRQIRNKNGEGYIDIAVGILIVAFVLLFIVSIASMVNLRQDLRYMCGELLDAATEAVRIGSEVDARYEELCAESGITPDVAYTASYYNVSEGTVQLGDSITCTLSYQMSLPGFGGFELPFSVTVTMSGLSERYWK